MKCENGASLVAQMAKSPPATLETWVRSLGFEDPLEKKMAALSNTLGWRIPWTEDLEGCSPRGHKESDTTELACLRSEGLGP